MNLTNGPVRTISKRLLSGGLIVVAIAALSACGQKEKKPGQALASVNGEEVTVLQLNEEMQRSNVQPAQQDAARKQLLAALIDRQLLQNEAAKEKLDRDPKVVQSIERAKALIIAQAYIQKRVGNITRPTKNEVADYYQQHPEFFSKRKQFDMRQLVLATSDLGPELKAYIDSVKSLDDVAAWMDTHQIKYARAQASRSSSDLPSEMSAKLLAMPKGQLFIVREGERSLLITIADVKDAPVTLEAASGQIEQFLFNKRTKEAADAEVQRLRAAAKIEYFNEADKPAAPAASAPAAAAPAAPAAAALAAPEAASSVNERGVAGLK